MHLGQRAQLRQRDRVITAKVDRDDAGPQNVQEAARDPALRATIRSKLQGLLPAVANALAPPDQDGTDWDVLGASGEEIRAFALDGLTRRLNIIGFPLSGD